MDSGEKTNQSESQAVLDELHPVNENDPTEPKTEASVPGLIKSGVRLEPDRLSTGVSPRPVEEAKRPEPISDLGMPLPDLSRPPQTRLATRVALALLVFGLGFIGGMSWHTLAPSGWKFSSKNQNAQLSPARKTASETPPKLWRPPKLKTSKPK